MTPPIPCPRPHIEFIQAQLLPWQHVGPDGARPGVEYKFLSRDPVSGACSVLLRYPAGWRREGEEHLLAAEEFYVLDGSLLIDDRIACTADCYAHWPRGWVHRSVAAPRGAVVLAFYDARPEVRPGRPDTPAREDLLVRRLDVARMPWDTTLNDPNLRHLGIARKNLRQDPDTGERSFLSLIMPHSAPDGNIGPKEVHPCVEEAYVLSGALSGPHGVMHPGAYFWRPPGIPHGPFGSRWGAVSLMRFVGGRHVNVWTDEQAPFLLDAPYQPVLPPDLSHLMQLHYTPAPTW